MTKRPQSAYLDGAKPGSGCAEDEPEELGVEEKDGGSDDPSNDGDQTRVGELTHFGAVACELDERDDRKGQLKTQDNLAENQQRRDFVLASDADDQGGGNDGHGASDEAAEPGLEANVQEAFHDNLARESAGERGVLAGGEQGTSKKSAGEADSQNGAEERVGIGDFG